MKCGVQCLAALSLLLLLGLSNTAEHKSHRVPGRRKIGKIGKPGKVTNQRRHRVKVEDQLFWQSSSFKEAEVLTTRTGSHVDDLTNSLSVGPRGPLVIQDRILIEHLASFDRERIPERVVHAKGAGAFGTFEVTNDITRYCKSKVFSTIGKKTDVAVRFSTVGGEKGSADSARDPRGFAVKFYTEEGNWDLTGNNLPVFFIRDTIFFPSFIHTQKRNPVTNLKDPNAFWDFMTLQPSTMHMVTFLFSDKGTPYGFRHMDGFGVHTFKMVNASEQPVYVKFHYLTDQGIRNLTAEESITLAGTDPDYAVRDLYNSILNGEFPSWSLYIQVMTYPEAEELSFNPFDATKVWDEDRFPLIPVGRFTLNKIPENFFADIEQLAFDPGNLVPGIEVSPDKLLQGRLFSYPDTQRHRLGANFDHIPVNRPASGVNVRHYQRDGPMCIFAKNQGGAPNYFPNSFSGPQPDPSAANVPIQVVGDIKRYNSTNDDNFSQAANLYNNIFTEDERARLVTNIAMHLKDAESFLQERAISVFNQIDPAYGEGVANAMKAYKLMKPATNGANRPCK